MYIHRYTYISIFFNYLGITYMQKSTQAMALPPFKGFLACPASWTRWGSNPLHDKQTCYHGATRTSLPTQVTISRKIDLNASIQYVFAFIETNEATWTDSQFQMTRLSDSSALNWFLADAWAMKKNGDDVTLASKSCAFVIVLHI